MPMTAMIRNLGKMTSVGLLNENDREPLDSVCSKLRDVGMLKSARIHPFNVLVALKTYMDGHGDKGKLRWNPNEEILTALEEAFYFSFKVRIIFKLLNFKLGLLLKEVFVFFYRMFSQQTRDIFWPLT